MYEKHWSKIPLSGIPVVGNACLRDYLALECQMDWVIVMWILCAHENLCYCIWHCFWERTMWSTAYGAERSYWHFAWTTVSSQRINSSIIALIRPTHQCNLVPVDDDDYNDDELIEIMSDKGVAISLHSLGSQTKDGYVQGGRTTQVVHQIFTKWTREW